jgi:hypothetical protein
MKGVKGVKYAPMPPRMYENSGKTGSFVHFLAFWMCVSDQAFNPEEGEGWGLKAV